MSTPNDSKQTKEVVSGDKGRSFSDIKALGTIGPGFMATPFQFKVPGINGCTTHFKPERDIPDLSGKVILVTGGNAGLGKQSVLAYAKHNPTHIFLAARSAQKAEAAIADVKKETPDANITHLPLDLSSFASITAAADTVKARATRLDILLLNAGIMAPPFGTTADGYESQLGTNHIGHALLTKLLTPLLLQTAAQPGADVRVIAVSSFGHRLAPAAGFLPTLDEHKALDPWQRYGQSKLANALFAQELARRHPQLTTAAVHPGIGVTDLYNASGDQNVMMKLSMKLSAAMLPNAAQLALNQLWASVSAKVESGSYYDPVGRKVQALNATKEKAEKLWAWTEEEFAKHGL